MKKTRFKNIIFWFVIFIITTLYIFEAIKCNTIIEDEAYTMGLIKHGFFDIINITSNDTHPPLSYFYFKIFTYLFNYNIIAAKIFAVIPLIFILIFGGLWIRKNLSYATSIFFLIIFFITPAFLQYAVIARMYTLATAFVFFAGIFAYEACTSNETNKWVLFCVFSLAAAYTHYYGLLSVTIISILMLFFIIAKNKKLLKNFFICVFACIVLYLPWISYLFMQIINKYDSGFALPPLNFRTYREILKNFTGTSSMPYCVLVIFIYIAIFIIIIKNKNKKRIAITCSSISIPLFTLFIATIISILIRPIIAAKYFIPASSFIPIFLAIGIDEIISYKKRIYHICAFGIMAILSLGSLFLYYNTIKHVDSNNLPLKYSNEVDTYIIYKNHGASWLTCYYVPNKNVVLNFSDYRQFSPNANPFNNLNYSEDVPKNDKLSMLLVPIDNKEENGANVPEVYSNIYNYQYVGTWYGDYRYSNRIYNAYLLNKK